MRRTRWILALLGLAALPLAADWIRGGSERCRLDGVELAPAFRVRVVAADGESLSFCGVRCAQIWLARCGPAPRRIRVTDGASGRECDARAAWYVRTMRGWDDRAPDLIRVFARRADAERFAGAYGGEILLASERPFAHLTMGGTGDAEPIQ